MQFHQKRQGPCKDPKQGQQQGQQFYGKRKQPFHKGPTPAAKKPVKAQSNWKPTDPNTCMKCGDTHHRQGFPCPASRFQCKNCSRIGHFTSRCLTKSRTINQINFQEEVNSLNAWQAQGDTDTFYICQVQEQQQAQQQNTQRVSKCLYVNLPLTARHHHKKRTYLHARIDPGADVNLMPVSVYKCLTGDKKLQHLGPVQCTMTVYTNNTIQNLGSTLVYVKYPGKHTQKLIFNVTNQEGSVLLCCEDVLSLELITPKDGLEEMEDEAKLISSTVDINQTTSVLTKQLVTSKDDIIKYFPEILEGLGKFPGEPYHINVDPNVPPK